MGKRHLTRWAGRALLGTAALGMALPGCARFDELKYVGKADLNHYRNYVESVAYPHTEQMPSEQVLITREPFTVGNHEKYEVWDLTLAEALHLTLANNRIVRTNTPTFSQQTPVFNNPNIVDSVYDPAIQSTGILFGNRGEEAALGAFDAQLSTSLLWGRDERLQNSAFAGANPQTPSDQNIVGAGGLPAGATLVQETAQFQSRLQKTFAYGGVFGVFHDWNYLGINTPAVLFPSSYQGDFGIDYQQPLLAGAGPTFTRIAGPIAQAFGGLTGVSQGVIISRINNDISIADFEIAVRNQLRDVENLYWDLYLQYRRYDAAVTARNSALQTWRRLHAIIKEGGLPLPQGAATPPPSPADEAQARDRYFETKALAQQALNNLYTSELSLRRLMNVPVNDGRIIRPADEPPTSEFVPEWQLSLAEGLTGRPELRRQKWEVKSLEMQLIAAQNLVRPRLDFVSKYQVNGFGDKLLSYDYSKSNFQGQTLNSGYQTMMLGNQTSWNLGFQFSMPIGLRQARSQVRNYELRLAKARDVLSMAEYEVAVEVATSFQTLAVQYATAQSNYGRVEAAREQVRLFEEQFQAGTVTLNRVVEAQASLANAQQSFYTSLANYAQAIVNYHYATGTLLDRNNIHLAEDGWDPRAQEQALCRAWARSYALDNPLLSSSPPDFVEPGPTPAPVPGTVSPEPLLDLPPAIPSIDAPLPAPVPQPEPPSGDQNPPPAPPEPPKPPMTITVAPGNGKSEGWTPRRPHVQPVTFPPPQSGL